MKRKILFFVNKLKGGGAEKVLHTLVANLDAEKYDITIGALHEETYLANWPRQVKHFGIFQHRNHSFVDRIKSIVANKIKIIIYKKLSPSWFYRLFVPGRYDTEVAFIEGYATRIIGGSTNPRSRKLAWLHTDLANNPWTKIAFRDDKEERQSYAKFDNVFVVSTDSAHSLKALYPELNNIGVKYNPIDDKEIRAKADESVSDNVPQIGMRLVSAGRLVEQKAFDRLIRVVAKLITEGHDIYLDIIGEGPERLKLEKTITENNLGDRVRLLGWKTNPYPYFRNADAFVCSSKVEGYSMVIAEALILGLPVITTDCGGVTDPVDNGKYGMIVPNNETALYDGLQRFLSDPQLQADMKAKAIERGTHFNLHSLISQIEKEL